MAYAFEKMIQYVKRHEDEVWFPSRAEIADYMLTSVNEAEPYKPLG